MDDLYPPAQGPAHIAENVRPRTAAIKAGAKALEFSNFRAWGTLTVARKVVKALEEAGYKVVPK